MAIRRALPVTCVALAVSLAACGDDAAPDAAVDAGAPDAAPLAVGDVVDLLPGEDGALAIDVATAAGTERYLAVIFSPLWGGAGPVPYSFGVSPASKPASPAPRPAISGDARRSPAHLSTLGALRGAALRRFRPGRNPPPVVGEIRSFSVYGDARVAVIDAEAALVTDTIAVWLDTTPASPATIDPTVLAELAAGYADVVLPRLHTFFGGESDVDGNRLVYVVMSPIVNENSGPIAYFYPCDLLDSATPGCSYSNGGEILYLTPPNILPPMMGSTRALLETLAHESQHMVFFQTKYLAHGTVGDVENMYLLEGLAALAQDLTGYQAGNKFVAKAGLDEILDLSTYDILEDFGAYDTSRDGAYRGGAYLLARYLYDQAGGDIAVGDGSFTDGGGIAFLHALCGSADVGLANLRGRIGLPLDEALFDFFTALAVTNRGLDHGPISADPRFNYRPTFVDVVTGRQRGFDAYATLPSGASMTGPATVPAASADGEIVATGVEYLELAAIQSGGVLRVRVTSPSEWGLRVRVARIE